MPRVVLLEPRQVGKTTLARVIADDRAADAPYLGLDDEVDRALLSDPRAFFNTQYGILVVMDDVQRVPELLVRRLQLWFANAGKRLVNYLLAQAFKGSDREIIKCDGRQQSGLFLTHCK